MKLRNFGKRLKQLFKDQGGMEALQTVCIVAISATVMIGAAKMGTEGKDWMKKNWDGMKQEADKGLKDQIVDAAKGAANEQIDKIADSLPGS